MERMTKIDENIQTAQNLLSGIVERCYELEEENKKLKEEVETATKCSSQEEGKLRKLEKENKKLNEKLDKLQDKYDELYIEKCNASNQWKCCEAENKELKDELLTYMRK